MDPRNYNYDHIWHSKHNDLNFNSLEPVIDPNARMTFLLDWELTLKCNLDCSYCTVGLYGGHDNSTKHPNIKECLPTIDFMYKYVDLYMENRIKGLKHVVLNVYGGESLYHKDIVPILEAAKNKYAPYIDRWKLIISTTTNLTISETKLKKLIPLIDEWTCSFHTESSDKQKERFFKNLLTLKSYNKSIKVIVLMHGSEDKFEEAKNTIQWCQDNNIKYLPRQLDQINKKNSEYGKKQILWFEKFYNRKLDVELENEEKITLTNTGRSCCGGRLFCKDSNHKEKSRFTENSFKGWHCSVNHFFLSVKQVTREVFNNKDCKTNLSNEIGSLGSLDDPKKILDNAKDFIQRKSEAFTICQKSRCFCGLCAPKAVNVNNYKEIFKKYLNEK